MAPRGLRGAAGYLLLSELNTLNTITICFRLALQAFACNTAANLPLCALETAHEQRNMSGLCLENTKFTAVCLFV